MPAAAAAPRSGPTHLWRKRRETGQIMMSEASGRVTTTTTTTTTYQTQWWS